MSNASLYYVQLYINNMKLQLHYVTMLRYQLRKPWKNSRYSINLAIESSGHVKGLYRNTYKSTEAIE